ncbi:hypothetical protein [Fictibacillus sp. BK138]|uniref:hypothetical protein n=1 Tax=Fictibacillus sp. BK138 TaxID=2512121 RepID=UPI00102A1503|nr:hypothetical protein [Fictibacillus sp. BK138]
MNQLANARMNGNFCTMGQQQVVQLVPKGSSETLRVTGGGGPGTDFTLVSFDPETCCAVFSFRSGSETRTMVIDCRCLCGIICIPQNGGGSAPTSVLD